MNKNTKVAFGIGGLIMAALGGIGYYIHNNKKKANAVSSEPPASPIHAETLGWEPPDISPDMEKFLAESESPSDDADDKKPHEKKDIYMITEDDFQYGEEYYTKNSLIWWKEDSALSDDNNELITNPERLLGEEIVYNLEYGDTNPVYVRNDKLGSDYEIEIESSSFARDILGEEEIT